MKNKGIEKKLNCMVKMYFVEQAEVQIKRNVNLKKFECSLQ